MKLHLSLNKPDVKDFHVDFVVEHSFPANNLLLLIYHYDVANWIILSCEPEPEPDIRTDEYSEYYITRVHHIFYGYFEYEGKRIDAQVGTILASGRLSEFKPVLLSHQFGDLTFKNSWYIRGMSNTETMIIDLEDFNYIRRLMDQPEYSLKDYIHSRITVNQAERFNMSHEDETTYFSLDPENFDISNLMTSKGIEIFFEEQLAKYGKK